jgi:2-phosphosulfolactate phosphatase
MKKIDVCLSPDLMHLYKTDDRTVIVVDILRATSCMTTAFAFGIESITPFASLEDCRAMKSQGYFTTGERDGKKVDGFDLGNSPFEYMDEKLKGKKIAFTTTNGTQAIAKSIGAKEIVIGSFLNLTAISKHIRAGNDDVLIVCAGWKGRFNLEDTLFAGALIESLKDHVQLECDAPQASLHIYDMGKSNMFEFLKNASHVKRLTNLNILEDIKFCLTIDKYDVVPMYDVKGLKFKV